MIIEDIKTKDLPYIISKDIYGNFKQHIKIIKETDYVFKTPNDWFQDSLTTWDHRLVKIPTNTLTQDRDWRCSLWLHEATHEMQYDRYGKTAFLALYTAGFGFLWLENEARHWQNLWLGIFGRHT